MPTRSVALFVNPAAGRGRAGRRLPRIRELFEASGITPNVILSNAVGDLEARVRKHVATGAGQVLIAGGDGSVHEAVNGMMADGHSAALGVVPSGTGNDFAKAAGIPLDWEAAATLLAQRIADEAPSRPIDLGRMNGRFFANGAGIGLDAEVTRIARSYRWPVGDLVYLAAIFRAMAGGIATPDIEIRAGDFRWDGPLTLASISNGPWIGGMFHMAPTAKNDDGSFELMVAAPVTRRRILRLLPRLMRGTHLREPDISHASVRGVWVRSAVPVPSHLDGEIQPERTDFDIDVLPSALRLL